MRQSSDGIAPQRTAPKTEYTCLRWALNVHRTHVGTGTRFLFATRDAEVHRFEHCVSGAIDMCDLFPATKTPTMMITFENEPFLRTRMHLHYLIMKCDELMSNGILGTDVNCRENVEKLEYVLKGWTIKTYTLCLTTCVRRLSEVSHELIHKKSSCA